MSSWTVAASLVPVSTYSDCWCWMAMVSVQVVWARLLSTPVLLSSAFIADGTNMLNIFYDGSFHACSDRSGGAFFSSCASRKFILTKWILCVQMCYRPKVPPGIWFHRRVSTRLSLWKSQFRGHLGIATSVFIRSINGLKTKNKERHIVLVNSYTYFSENVNAVYNKNNQNRSVSFELQTCKYWQFVFNYKTSAVFKSCLNEQGFRDRILFKKEVIY